MKWPALVVAIVGSGTLLAQTAGLKLESARGAVEVIVIDHVQHPTPD